MDACHMLKLARNFLGQIGAVFIPGFKMPAKWAHTSAQNDFQKRLGFRLANKVTDFHVTFDPQKMKVSVAAQVYCEPVADV